jgi:transposase
MEVVVERCAGLDVHSRQVTACALWRESDGRLGKTKAEFATTAAGLAKMAGWLREHGAAAVGMESTGVYWMPVYARLEEAGGFDLTVANARHIKAVPGRKTDMNDAEWLARLIRYGLVRKSFVPPKELRDLRDLTRYRRSLVEAQGAERRRLIKLLDAADVKLAGVLSDVFGVTGRAILRAIIAGGQSAAAMAKLARGQVRKKRPQLIDALAVEVDAHRRRLLAMQLARVEAAEADIAALDSEIVARLAPYAEQMALLTTIPGIDWVTAATIIAEIGIDMAPFPSAAHLAAWAGVCPGNNESAGKRRRTGARKGNAYLKTALRNAAIGASRTRGSFFKTKYSKLEVRRGGGRAALALGHKLLVIAYHVLRSGEPYRELGEHYHDKRNADRTVRRCVRRLQNLGFTVTIAPAPPEMAHA